MIQPSNTTEAPKRPSHEKAVQEAIRIELEKYRERGIKVPVLRGDKIEWVVPLSDKPQQ